MAAIVSIVYTPAGIERKPADRFARAPLEEATLIAGKGIEGDRKSGGPERHLNIMAAEALEQLRSEGFKTGPGEMGEQIIVAGLDVAGLKPNQRLRLGEAVVEVVIQRTGCDRFEHIQGKPKASVRGRLGVMARVVSGGRIQVGSEAALLDPPI